MYLKKFTHGISVFMLLFMACKQVTTYEGVESAGVFQPLNEGNELAGNAYVLADNQYMDLVTTSTSAYNAKDSESMRALYNDDFKSWGDESMPAYFESMSSLNMDIFAMIPIHLQGDERKMVLTWSREDRNWKNGSKERVNLFEIYSIDADNKLMGWNQWSSPVSNPEFTDHGLPAGGKFIGLEENSNTGKRFVFSNRGEVEKLEALCEAANNLDTEKVKEYVADEMVFEGNDGSSVTISLDDWEGIFAQRISQNWSPWAMIPIKIEDTDPASGVIVMSTAEIHYKDGTNWKSNLSEIWFFDLDGKVERVQQYSRAAAE